MGEMFREFFNTSTLDFKNLEEDTLVIFDTNTLLNIYRYSDKTRNKLVETMKEIKANIWIPYQVGLEFNLQRRSVQQQIKDKLDNKENEITKYFSDFEKDIDSKLLSIPLKSTDIQKNKKEISDFLVHEISKLKNQTNKKVKKLFKMIDTDKDLIDEFEQLFHGRIGDCYTPDELAERLEDAEDRYKKAIPPGYGDIKKTDIIYYNDLEIPEKFGDLIIWHQILDKAKDVNIKKIVFITDDQKSDWWYRLKGKTIGPRAELKNELFKKSNADLFMYSSNSFLNKFTESEDKDLISEPSKEIVEIAENSNVISWNNFNFFKNEDIIKELTKSSDIRYNILKMSLELQVVLNKISDFEKSKKDPFSSEFIGLILERNKLRDNIEVQKKLLETSEEETNEDI